MTSPKQSPEQHRELEPVGEQYVRDKWEEVVLPHVSEELHETAGQILNDTIESYSEEHRKYHTIDHIADCLKKLESYKGREDYLQLFLAILWHDEVYSTDRRQEGQPSNEEQSADIAEARMGWLGLPGADTVYRLIRITESHIPEAEDEALVTSIDMSILAEDEEVYDTYTANIRKEYKQYSDEQYRAGRLAALGSFKQPFHHPDFMHLNPVAQDNVDREITQLEAA